MQHLEFGVSSLPFLSYEAVLLYLLSVEAGLNPGAPSSTPACCRLRTSSRLREDADASIARFSAAFGVLLGLIKLDDDVRDERRLISRLGHWLLSRRQSAVHEFFTAVDDQFSDRVAELIEEHLELERRWQHGSYSLNEYAEPTARSFGYIFSLAARSSGDSTADHRELFEQVGRSIGRAILAFDCAVDWHDDQRHGQFNPLPGESAIGAALDLACESLDQAAWLCETRCGESSLCARVLTSVFERTAAFVPRHLRRTQRPGWKQRLSQWGLSREPGYVYARFDCCEVVACCDGVGEAASCCGGAGDGAAGCGGHGCGCETCVWCGDGCCDPCGDKISGRSGELAKLLGETGWTRSVLKPNGVVLINGQRHRAQAEDGQILVNVEIQVVDVVRSTLVVRPLEEVDSSAWVDDDSDS